MYSNWLLSSGFQDDDPVSVTLTQPASSTISVGSVATTDVTILTSPRTISAFRVEASVPTADALSGKIDLHP